MTIPTLFQILAVLLTGMVAGLLYGYDCSVIGGLGALSDKAYLGAFQSINMVIQNAYFFISFIGCLAALPMATLLANKAASPTGFYFLMAATIVYMLGVFGTTMFGNVPLNNSLAQANVQEMTLESLQTLRQQFEPNWNTYHHIRTYTAMLSFLLTILSMLKKS